ncbi:MAG: DUF2062 domain-containing protein [Desulfoprunum sp.]|jgi:hypothetical protein
MKLDRIRKYYYLRFIRLKGDPRSLALGTAIGVFVGLTPTMPLHTIIILLLAFLTRTSAIAGILVSMIVCNPLTYIPIYYLSTIIGNTITPYELNWEKVQAVVDGLSSSQGFVHSFDLLAGLGQETVVVLLVGGVIFAFPFAVVSYYLALRIFVKIRAKRQAKHILN